MVSTFALMKEVVLNPTELPENNVVLLTPAEFKVVQEVAKGHSSKEIGILLSISMKTVEVHRHNILKKTKAKNFVELVLELHKKGLL